MSITEDLLKRIDGYCGRVGLSATRFGLAVCNDGKLVSGLREGRQIRASTIDKINAFLDSHSPSAAPDPVAGEGGGPPLGASLAPPAAAFSVGAPTSSPVAPRLAGVGDAGAADPAALGAAPAAFSPTHEVTP